MAAGPLGGCKSLRIKGLWVELGDFRTKKGFVCTLVKKLGL
jgi:hypothetical protein